MRISSSKLQMMVKASQIYYWLLGILVISHQYKTTLSQPADMFVSTFENRMIAHAESSEDNGAFVGANFSALPLGRMLVPQAIDFDPSEQTIYWTDYDSIFRSNLDGSNKGTIASTLVQAPIGLSIDLVQRRVYWADAFLRRIESSNLDGTDRVILIDQRLNYPHDIVVSSKHSLMFWPDRNNPVIEKAFTNGTKRTVLVDSGLRAPTGVALDDRETRVYWCDHLRQSVESVDFSGGNRQVLIDGVAGYYIRPWRLAVYGEDNDIYFTDYVNQLVFGPDQSGQLVPLKSKNVIQNPFDVCVRPSTLHQEERVVTEPPSLPADMFVSAINNRMIAKAESSDDDGFVGATFAPLPLGWILAPQALDFDPSEQMIYWTDHNYASIFRSNLDGSNKETIASTGIAAPVGLSLDLVQRRVYWADASYDRIESANLDGTDRTVLIDEGLDYPHDIVVSSIHSLIFWPDRDNLVIEKALTDGTNRTVLVDSNLSSPTGVALDNRETRVYWCDYQLQRVESVDFSGGYRQVLINGVAGYVIRPWRLAVYGKDNDIYFTDNVNQLVFGRDQSGQLVPLTSRNFFQNPFDVCVRPSAFNQGDIPVV